MNNDESVVPKAGQQRFETTQWSLVLSAGQRATPEGREAFARLCQKYWYPLYAHTRRLSGDPHRASDLTQGFFEKALDKNYVAQADPRRGRFRTFLLTSFSHFVANESDKARAQKRGAGRVQQWPDFAEGERRYVAEPVETRTPEKEFDRRWAENLLAEVLASLQAEYEASGRATLFAELRRCLVPHQADQYRDIAGRLAISEGAVKVAVCRLRRRYRDKLCEEIAATMADATNVEDEIRCLFNAFSSC